MNNNTTDKPTIKFTNLYRILDICDIVREGELSRHWDGTYRRFISGNSSVNMPMDGGSQILLKSLPLKPKDQLPKDVRAALDHQEALYLVTSNRYPIHYVGITSKGIAGVFKGSGRFSHHARKLLASVVNKGTNHTDGWISHARERYTDLTNSIDEGRQPTDEELLGDIFIAFGVSESDWQSRDHEGMVSDYFGERISHVKSLTSSSLNSTSMSKKPAYIHDPCNFEILLFSY